MKRKTSLPPRPLCESLEPRWLAAAHTAYNFGRLTGYELAGRSWTYDVNYSLTSDVLPDSSGSTQATVSVTTLRRGTLFQVTSGGSQPGGGTIKILQPDRLGTNIIAVDSSTGLGKVKLTLTGTRLAPPSLAMNTVYSDTGTFTGSFTGNAQGIAAVGTITGNTSTKCELLHTQTVTVPDGTFNTVEGTDTLVMTGTLKIKAQGQSVSASYSATYTETFWAVQGVGIVRSLDTVKIGLSVKHQGASIVIHDTSLLTGRSQSPGARLVGLFSRRPIRPA
jgi:hypothetical protein